MRYMKPLQLFHDLKNQQRGRLLGLDVGDKYVGLALSDFDNNIASPFSVLVRKKTNITLVASDFESLCSDLSNKTSKHVIGISFDKHQVSSDNVELLLKPLNLNHSVLSKTMLDKFAAVGILQGYMDFVNRKMKLTAMDALSTAGGMHQKSQLDTSEFKSD
ncbi:putative pre-16S rRNA nuclease [Glycine max]|nr:putative pre-16S rRNA nuclease [Glycine max]